MVLYDQWYGGRTSTPSETLDWYLREICDYLQELKGNEAVWDHYDVLLAEERRAVAANDVVHRHDAPDVQVPGSHPWSADWFNDFVYLDDDLNVVRERLAREWVKTAHSSATKPDASGYRSNCSLVVKPNATTMSTRAERLGHNAQTLWDMTSAMNAGGSGGVRDSMPDFVTALKKEWPATSLGSESFYTFYEDLSELTFYYAVATRTLAGTSAVAAKIVETYQEEVNRVCSAARQEVIGALEYWQTHKAPYSTSTSKTAVENWASKVADGVGTATGIASIFQLDKVPVVGTVMDVAGDVTNTLAYVTTEWDWTITSTHAPSADSISTGLSEGLAKAQTEMFKALDTLHTGGTGSDGVTVPPFDSVVKDAAGKAGNDGDGNPQWRVGEVEF